MASRTTAVIAMCAVLLAAAGACTNNGAGLRVGLAYDVGGRGDKAFNDAAAAGLDRVRAELAGQVGPVRELAAREHETEKDKYDRLKLLCNAGFGVVIAVGYEYAGAEPATGPLARAAKECPNTRFAIVDDARVVADNVAGLVFADEQGAFLVGAAAALKSASKHVGFVGACRTAVIARFEAGFRAGAVAARPGTTVTSSYLAPDQLPCPGFADPDGARAAADELYAHGADVVFHATGGSGTGVFQSAAAAPKRWAIGVDTDQYVTVGAPLNAVILTSMVKRVDTAVFDFVRDAADGRFTAGERRFDLAAGGVGYATSGGHVDDIVPELSGYQKQIVDGAIVVPAVPG
ncbi:MAG TPA: BMP family ABC transporter substrate-binding protein [Micromonosporaceae bacterium]|nr:BMP family ABC transporter substrate-binding protein [Micromonosporaceae bacterium]